MDLSELIKYFTAEKQAAFLLIVLAIVGITFGLYLLVTVTPFRAMMWPLLAIAVIQIAVGIGLLLRTNPQVTVLQ